MLHAFYYYYYLFKAAVRRDPIKYIKVLTTVFTSSYWKQHWLKDTEVMQVRADLRLYAYFLRSKYRLLLNHNTKVQLVTAEPQFLCEAEI